MNQVRTAGRAVSVVLAVVLLVASGCARPRGESPARASSFGRHNGYSEASYDGWRRASVYVPMKDGTRVAVDSFLPTKRGVAAAEPLPVILHYTRYIRAVVEDGKVVSRVDRSRVLQDLLKHGYAVAVADARGTGASFGVHYGPYSIDEQADSYDIIEWLAAQPWCDGNVGMQGGSYPGLTQYHAAAQRPPHLRAIMPEVAGPALFEFTNRGGTWRQDFIRVWGGNTKKMDLGQAGMVAPVDADPGGKLRDAAIAEHAANWWAEDVSPKAQYRDFKMERPDGVIVDWDSINVIDDVSKIDGSGVAIYHVLGWYDIYTTQQAWMYANLHSTPQKMMIGPWTHGGRSYDVYWSEMLRWYDHWLKGIDNGVMDEPPIHYYVMRGNNTVPERGGRRVSEDQERADDPASWTAADTWPPPGIRLEPYYLAAGPSGTVSSVNDGGLSADGPPAAEGRDAYAVDYTCTTGEFNRWRNGYGASRSDPEGTTFFDERTPEDRKALTYTSPALADDLTLVGYPVVHLWVSSNRSDGDFFAYLEEVDAGGRSHYVSEGALRASHRALGPAPFDNFGLPYHLSVAAALVPLPKGEPVELVFDLEGTAIVMDRGHRIRVTVTGADTANYQLYPDPSGGAPAISVYYGSGHASRIELPVFGAQ